MRSKSTGSVWLLSVLGLYYSAAAFGGSGPTVLSQLGDFWGQSRSVDISIGGASVSEGDLGLSNASFAVVLSSASGLAVSVWYATSDGTANAGGDYQAVSDELIFAPGETLKTIDVPIIGELVFENDETFSVDLSDPSNATIVSGHAEGVITNDDSPPEIVIDDVTIAEGHSGTREALFSVYLSVRSELEVTVDYQTADGSAAAGSDYVSASGTLTFPPDDQSANEVRAIAVTINGDSATEGDEEYVVNLSNPLNATIADFQGFGVIEDDEDLGEVPVEAVWQVARQGMRTFVGSASDGNVYVLVGVLGDIWVSTDTLSWVKATNPDPGYRCLYGVTYGDGQFVAVGTFDWSTWTSPVVLTSPNGFTWAEQVCCEDTTAMLRGVTYGDGQFVAVGWFGGIVVTSPDGVTWTQQSSGVSQRLYSVAYGDGVFVAVGRDRTVITSPDGIIWTKQPGVPSGIVSALKAILYDGSQFVVVASDPSFARDSGAGIMTSPDGVTWTQQTAPTNQPLVGITFGDGLLVAVGYTAAAEWTGQSVLTSTDAVTWTPQELVLPSGVGPYLNTVVHGPHGFVAGGAYYGGIFTSPDGVTPWVSRTLESSRDFRGVAHNGSVYCAVGAFGGVASSPDGINWTNQGALDHTIYRAWNDVVFANGVFTAVGLSDAIMRSPDCSSWTLVNPSTPLPAQETTSNLRSITYEDGLYVVAGDDYADPEEPSPKIFTSADGEVWTEQVVSKPDGSWNRFESVTYGNERFVAFGETGDPFAVVFYTSEDGVAWTLHEAGFFEREYEDVNEVAFGDGRFAVVADRIRSSENGLDWTMRLDYPPDSGTELGPDYFRGVTYGNGRFFAVGQPGAAYVSADGSTWTPNAPVTIHALNTVAHSKTCNRVVALGESAIIFADFPPTISVDDVAVGEGDAGTTIASFTVGLSAASSKTVAVNFHTADGEGVGGVDYEVTTGEIEFAPGTRSMEVEVSVFGDTDQESNETFFVVLSDPTNATIFRGSAQGTIENDDGSIIFADGFESGNTGAWS